MKKLLVAASFLTVALTGGPASAADCEFSTPAVADPACSVDVKPVTLDPSPQIAAPKALAPSGNGQLPVTGTETATFAMAGALMVAGGGLMVARSRKATVEA